MGYPRSETVRKNTIPGHRWVVGLRAAYIICLASVCGSVLWPSLLLNLVRCEVFRSVWQDRDRPEVDRQAFLRAQDLLRLSPKLWAQRPPSTANSVCSEIPSSIIAYYHLREHDLSAAIAWIRQTSGNLDRPHSDVHAVLPGWVSVTRQGNLILDWNETAWDLRPDSQPANALLNDQEGWMSLSYSNSLGQRDRVIYQWKGPMRIPYWHTLELTARAYPGTYLTLETHSARGVKRHISYHAGNGHWNSFSVPLDSDEITWLYVSLTEPSPGETTPEYRVDLQPLVLSLDHDVGTCAQ